MILYHVKMEVVWVLRQSFDGNLNACSLEGKEIEDNQSFRHQYLEYRVVVRSQNEVGSKIDLEA